MRAVIYKIKTFEVVKVVDAEAIDVVLLPEDEDFMPIEIWNKAEDKERFPMLN